MSVSNFTKCKINSELYNTVLQLHDKYCKVRNDINEAKGIITPIRAVVLKAPEVYAKLMTVEYSELLAKNIESIGKITLGGERKKLSKTTKRIDINPTFLNRSKIVGYFVALPSNDSFCEAFNLKAKIGMSYCRPEDFQVFNKELAIIKAYECALKGGVHTPLSNKFVSIDKDSCTAYFWYIGLDDQFKAFIHRTLRYFK